MKPLHDLTIDDLSHTPVWQYEGDRDSEAYVVPSDLASLTEFAQGVFIVRTTFTLNDGTSATGYCSPADDSGIDYVQPVIITRHGHVRFYYESNPPSPEPETSLRKLERSFEDVFPVHYRAEVPVDGRLVEGVVSELCLP